MSPITAAHYRTDVELRIGGRAHLFRVRPATVAEAIGLIEAAQDADAAWPFIRSLVFGWLPVRMASALMCESMPRERGLRIVMECLTIGTARPEETEKGQKAAKQRAVIDGWHEIISDYVRAYGESVESVMRTPWPTFVGMLSCVERAYSRDMVRMIHVAGMPYIKNDAERKRAMDALYDRAGYRDKAEAAQRPAPEWMKDDASREAWKQEKMAEALRVRALWDKKSATA